MTEFSLAYHEYQQVDFMYCFKVSLLYSLWLSVVYGLRLSDLNKEITFFTFFTFLINETHCLSITPSMLLRQIVRSLGVSCMRCI